MSSQGTKAIFGKGGFDEDLYGGINPSIFRSSLPPDEGIDDEDEEDLFKKPKRGALLNSYTAPKQLLESIPTEDKDPFEGIKRKTVSEREDEYRARWRKRKLSPPKADPWAATSKGGKEVAAPADPNIRSYRDIMMEANLEKEHHQVLRNIEKKKKDEEEERKKAEKEKEEKNQEKTEKERKPKTKIKWIFSVAKRGAVLSTIPIPSGQVVTFGRSAAVDIQLDHPSCSKDHAVIECKEVYIENKKGKKKKKKRPCITDLGSTNGTHVNDTKLEKEEPHVLKEGDVVKFGGSLREYKLSKLTTFK
eukprot:TRINITY_DN3644_c0_g1_i1.p1 TRINITY_DN3644_c0_g1~~TRINITY_DN3644_c0_g1_i1.p1  ORF type:complete len:305 (+),score=104.49 TRINITY_DN3644_c0_g1_i1:127-1041(+)